jgi:hypothetical protein
VKGRRVPGRVAALLGAAPVDVLLATAHRPTDARHHLIERAMRTGAAVRAVPDDWHWPRWLDRQLRPTHPAHVSPGDSGLIENVTGRDWRTLGTVTSGPLALVDPRGVVTPVRGGWSLDWLVDTGGAAWHRPSRDAGVRQRLVGGAPVVETACRVPGGDAVHRAFCATGPGGLGDVVVVEIENQSPAPFAVAFALRPADLLGAGNIATIAVDDALVRLDGRPVLAFERRPARWCAADGTRDSLSALPGDLLDEVPFTPVRCPRGLAQAAFVVPVPHRTSVRVVLTMRAGRRDRPVLAGTLPAAGAVARGWDAHADQAAHIELPDRRLHDAYDNAVRSLLIANASGNAIAPAGREEHWSVADEAVLVHALAAAGLPAEAGALLRRRGEELELDGWFRREEPSLERNNAIFDAVAICWHLHRERIDIEPVVGPVVKAAHWSERHRARNAPTIDAPAAWAAHRSLSGLARALDGIGQREAAQDAGAFAARFILDLDEPQPSHTADTGSIAVSTPAGIDTVATVAGAAARARAADERALETVAWLAEISADSGCWPTFVLPRLGTGAAGSGDDPVVAAAVIHLVRAFVVREEPHALALLPLVPPAWLGQSVDVHELPTAAGRLSFAVRWHGARPALLWELDAHDTLADDAPPVVITAPGLDPGWSTTEAKGEALLSAPAIAPSAVVAPADPGASFGGGSSWTFRSAPTSTCSPKPRPGSRRHWPPPPPRHYRRARTTLRRGACSPTPASSGCECPWSSAVVGRQVSTSRSSRRSSGATSCRCPCSARVCSRPSCCGARASRPTTWARSSTDRDAPPSRWIRPSRASVAPTRMPWRGTPGVPPMPSSSITRA